MSSQQRRWHTSSRVRQHARALRATLTRAELILWQRLRGRQLHGAHFRKQHPVGPYVIDFVCLRAGLAIEIDGDAHIDRDDYDAERTRWLQRTLGYRVLRFSNEEVQLHIEGVLQVIAEALSTERLP